MSNYRQMKKVLPFLVGQFIETYQTQIEEDDGSIELAADLSKALYTLIISGDSLSSKDILELEDSDAFLNTLIHFVSTK